MPVRVRSPGEADTTAVAHAVTKNLARDHMVASEDGIEFLKTSAVFNTNIDLG